MNKRRRRSSESSVGSVRLKTSKTRSLKNAESASTSTKLSGTESLKTAIPTIRYPDEIVLIFYDSMLDNIVETWETIAPPSQDAVKQSEEEISVKNFKEIKNEDLIDAEVVAVDGSQLSLAKKPPFLKKTSSNVSTSDLKQMSISIIY